MWALFFQQENSTEEFCCGPLESDFNVKVTFPYILFPINVPCISSAVKL